MKTIFNRDFAPHEGLVKYVEKPLRDEICLNGSWQFQPTDISGEDSQSVYREPSFPPADRWESTALKVPSPWNVNGFSRGGGGDFRAYPSYPDKWKDVKAGWLKRKISVPADWRKSRIILHFEAVAGYAKVYVNGKLMGDNFDPFLPFHFDVTEECGKGDEMEILVWVAHGSLIDKKGKYGYRQYVAGSFWGSYIAGIWQDVFLQKMPVLHVSDTFIKPSVDKDLLEVEVTVRNTGREDVSFHLDGSVKPWINETEDDVVEAPEVKWSLGNSVLSLKGEEQTLVAGKEQVLSLSIPVERKLELWSPGNPALYGLMVSIISEKEQIDNRYTRFGWRQFSIKGRKFLLNGETFRIKGDSWHFTGIQQMTRRYAYGWYKMLKEANGNGIRLHAQVYPRFYLEMADEMGICILDETGIWHSDAGPKIDSEAYWESCRNHVRSMVMRDRNYPSVMGWSVCNETVEVTKMVFHAPKKIIDKNVEEIRKWIAITRGSDPTRQWISGDGEIYGKIGLPTLIEHYAWRGFYPLLSLVRKPWGTGETGMAYFGTPLQISKINGHRAFESQEGRMEGVAAEAFDLIRAQRKAGSSYASVFNLIWYGLKPLPLGLADTSRSPELTDGIFFGDYIEGKAGCQPERLGPYGSTVNPGYDPALPLYEPWPLFNGVQAAFSDDYRKRKNCWKVKKDSTASMRRAGKKKSIVWLSDEKDEKGKRLFENCALRFAELSPLEKQLIIIDGSNPPLMNQERKDILRSAAKQGSTLLFWKADEKSGTLIKSLTGSSVEFYEREASSYIIRGKHPVVRNESNKSLYFSEKSDAPLSVRTIGGNLIKNSNPILEACNTDWKKWNYQGEEVKTAKVLRSEREAKHPGSVMVQQPCGSGEIIVSTLDLFALSSLAGPRVAAMMKNLGVPLKGPVRKIPKALNRRYVLNQVLKRGADGETQIVKLGVMGDSFPATGEKENYSFWVYSLRSLDDLLIEPGIPRMDMIVASRDDVDWSLNGREMKPCGGNSPVCEGVPLNKGWNRIVIKAPSPFKLSFSCTQKRFLKKLESYVYR